MCVHRYSLRHLNTVPSDLLPLCFEVTKPQKGALLLTAAKCPQINYQMGISLLDPSKIMMTILDSPLGEHQSARLTVLVLGNLWIQMIYEDVPQNLRSVL